MTRRLKCRIDPEQSPYTCVLSEHKRVRRGREMIGLLAVVEPKPKPAKIRAVSYEAALDQLFKRVRSARACTDLTACRWPKYPLSARGGGEGHDSRQRSASAEMCAYPNAKAGVQNLPLA